MVLVTAMSLTTVSQRPGRASVIVIGIAGVVGVLMSLLTLSASVAESTRAAGRDDRAIVLRSGIDNEPESVIFPSEAQAVAEAPGVARTAEGKAAAAAEMLAAVNLPRKLDGALAGAMVRGVSLQFAAVRPEIEIEAGRLFTPGLRELIVGRTLQKSFEGLAIGDRVRLPDGEWTVVGVYATGDMWESMLLTDATTLMSSYKRNVFSSVTVRLTSPAAFQRFRDALSSDPTLRVNVMRESDYYSKGSDLGRAFAIVSYVIGAIMAAGALFGALNTMYSSVSSRGVEVATLRAIGFSGASVVVSVLAEALLLAMAGALAGAAISWALLSGSIFAMGDPGGGAIAAELRVTPRLVGIGFVWALMMGLLGGLFPALRAARLPVATAFRASWIKRDQLQISSASSPSAKMSAMRWIVSASTSTKRLMERELK
jgi:putative ABC transport system permease protein